MPLLTEDSVRAAARQTHDRLYKSYSTILEESAETQEDHFDIFLSHSIHDAEIVHGVHVLLKRLGYSVYVDWIIDREMDRNDVSPETAVQLKRRMRQCKAMFYLATHNSGGSKWMPWELGFFDGYSTGRVAILPIANSVRNEYDGQEYLGVYPYIDIAPRGGAKREILWVNVSSTFYARFDQWLQRGYSAFRKHG